jgi:dTDP-4-dehydrorhamnose reductase
LAFKILVRSVESKFLTLMRAAFEDSPVVLLCPGSAELDWSVSASVSAYIAAKSPSVVVNYSLLPVLESIQNKSQSDDLQPRQHTSLFSITPCADELLGVEYVAAACQNAGLVLIHISSYRAFGEDTAIEKLTDGATPSPCNELGVYLLALEQAVSCVEHHVILRPSWMLSGEIENLLDHMIPSLLNGQPFVVSDHNYGNPLQSKFVVRAVAAVIQQVLCGAENWGVYHLHSSDTCSEAEFCDNLVRLLKAELGTEIEMPGVAAKNDSRKLMSPNANLQGRRCTDDFGIQLPSWRNGLKKLVRTHLERSGYLEKKVLEKITDLNG